MLTLLEAAKISRNPLARGILTAIATTDELVSQIRMMPKSGESFSYDREKALATVPFYETAPVSDATTGAPGTPANVAESSSTFDKVTVPMRSIVGNVDVSNFAEEQQDDPNQQSATQIVLKMKGLGRQIGQKLITGNYANTFALSASVTGVTPVATAGVGPNQDSRRHGPGGLLVEGGAVDEIRYRAPGDSRYGDAVDVSSDGTFQIRSWNPNKWIKVTVVTASLPATQTEVAVRVTPVSATEPEWDGLITQVPDSQLITSTGTDGDDLTFEVLDRMIDEFVKVRSDLRFLFNAKMKAEYYSLVRSLGGSGPEVTTLPGVNGPVPVYRGIPILQTDWIATNESKGANSDLSSVYLASLDPIEGFYLGVGQRGQAVTSNLDPRDARIMGVRLQEIGQLENQDARRWRVTFRGATAVGSDLAICRASELKTATSS